MPGPAGSRRAGVPEIDVERAKRFCERRIPAHLRDEIRLEVGVRGSAITIFERRPPWIEWAGPEWSRMKIAQLRWDAAERLWRLYWADRNGRWLEYWNAEP